MSASVATSAVGLLDRPFTPPTDPRDSRVPEWQDHMEVEHSTQGPTTSKENESANSKDRRSTSGAQSGDERRNVLSGLLAALATNSNSTQVTQLDNQTREHRSVTPPQDSPISVASPESHRDSLTAHERGAHDDNNTTTIAAGAFDSNYAHLTNAQTENDVSTRQNGPVDSAQPAILGHAQSELSAPMPPNLDNIPIPAFEMPSDPLLQSSPPNSSPANIKRQYDAFARLEFDDGIFYLNTYQCELGRDQHAYHIALRREREAREAAERVKIHPESSRGRASQISNVIKAESQIQGSVVSEAGGFAGVDEQPVEGYGQDKNGQASRSRASHSSDASIVRPADVLHNPSLHTPFDYNKEASRQFAPPAPLVEQPVDEDERPAPITADHLPDPNSCPLIPIHVTSESETTELDGLKAISRRHMKIFWSWENSSFMLEVLGRNGAFLEGEFVAPSEVVALYTGASIQISSVNFVFRLPHIEPESPSAESASNIGEPLEIASTNRSDLSEVGQKGKLKLKLTVDAAGSQAAPANGESKRRGPGRPPKDGVMSQRERKEREKADKEAKTRALNGDPLPPVPQRKPSKSQLPKPEQIADPAKPEKRKYNKRKREDGEEEQVLPSIEGADEVLVTETPQPQPAPKKARTKSYSPPYKPKEECTQADLTRPAHNYAVLLYQVLSQTGEISLRQIYKEMQSRWPFFKYMVESDGWTSSVRHNLNQEVGKLFVKGRKEGKGYTWLAKPNAMEEYQAQKNKRSNAPAAPRPRPAPARANFAPSQGQQLTWQNSGPAPQPNGAGNASPHPGQWNGPQNNANRPGQAGSQPSGQPQIPGQAPYSQSPMQTIQDPEGPAPPHMIVTFLGVRIIDRFENTMMGQLRQRDHGEEEKMTRWANIFRSARARCLNGSPASSMPEGETEDERTIMTHINNFVKMYKNPAFKGFYAQPPVTDNSANPSNSPAPTMAAHNSPSVNANAGQQVALNSASAETHGHPQSSQAGPTESTTQEKGNHIVPTPSSMRPDISVGAKPAAVPSVSPSIPGAAITVEVSRDQPTVDLSNAVAAAVDPTSSSSVLFPTNIPSARAEPNAASGPNDNMLSIPGNPQGSEHGTSGTATQEPGTKVMSPKPTPTEPDANPPPPSRQTGEAVKADGLPVSSTVKEEGAVPDA